MISIVLYIIFIFSLCDCNEDRSTVDIEDSFFSFGEKKKLKDVSSKLENAVLKSKIDVLGEILKEKVDVLRNAEVNHPVELIFLVDASSSVGAENFESELKFIKKLLADFTVSSDHTRVALISFASPNDVITHVDQISVTNVTHNKCSLMNQHVNYSGGGTFTLGALLQAKELFSHSRSGAHCALFLVTDGFSNGGDPRPVAKELRAAGVTIFTFGISTGNRAELYDMASVPGHEHSFLLDSFAEFEALARRALHEDLAVGYYVTVEDQSLCEFECSSEASCTCGLRTGHYSCLCPPGFYGPALSNLFETCTLCPNGTYNDGAIPGDVTVCIPCPDVNHVTYGPAKSPEDCFCKQGFKPSKKGNNCRMVHCPELEIPENGYMVQGWCSTVMNAGCGIRCNAGYSLSGSSVRLCLPNGTWSGTPAKCTMKRCPRLQPPQNGNISCTPDDGEDKLQLDAECQASCNNGYSLIGSRKRTCLPLSKWDGIPNKCRIIHCRSLPEITNGYYEPENCTSVKKHEFGTVCRISCNSGYELNGPDIRKCSGKGTWTNKKELTTCIDMTPPLLKCPDNITVVTEPEDSFAYVTWMEPLQPDDNSNQSVILWTLPATEQPMKLGIGETIITYVATDSSFNQATCDFIINVLDKEPPVVTNCDSEESYTVSMSERDDIKWLEPEFHDNSGEPVKVEVSHNLEKLPIGTTNVKFTAFDSSGNNNTCSLLITVIEDLCELPNDPLNGKLDCMEDEEDIGALKCSVTCDKGFVNTLENDTFKYFCDSNVTLFESYIPDCTEIEIPNTVIQEGSVGFEASSEDWCNSSDFINQISTAVQDHLDTVCINGSCKVHKKIGIECENAASGLEEVTNKVFGRKRREAQKTIVNVKFALEGKRDDKQYNIKQTLQSRLGKDDVFSKVGLFPSKYHNLVWEQEWPLCSPGFVIQKQMCFKCPAGTAWDGQNSCLPCPLGSYQPMAGQNQCLKCPDFTSTRRTHAHNIRACKNICPPGTYSRNKGKKGRLWKPGDVGVVPCVSCPIGSYQPKSGAITCLHCNKAQTTRNRGSISDKKCMLPVEVYCQNVTCQNNGLCKEYKGHILCSCPKDFLGSHCETKLDVCLSKPCLHGGTCISNDFGYICTCPIGFKGKNCQEEIDECALNPCKNSGECIDLIGEFHCHCPPLFYGSVCELKIDECETEPCADGAQCVNQPGGGYQCLCGVNYSGKLCEITPCQKKPYVCHNNASCHSLSNKTNQFYRCDCTEGWAGELCDVQINPCDSTPCKNNGSCVILSNGKYTCFCKPGYYGVSCESYVSFDYALHFPSPGTLNYIKIKGPENPLSELTLCMWVQSSFIHNYGTLFSYATILNDNAFTLTDYNGLVLYINGNRVITDVRVNDGLWHSICVQWTVGDGLWQMYLDGNLLQSGIGLSNNSCIPGHGIIVIGQDQDRFGGGFNPAEALVGSVAAVDLWDYRINEIDIIKHAKDCNSFTNYTSTGNILNWGQLRYALYGQIEINLSPLCKGCDSPFVPQHSSLKLINSGSTAVYTCDTGYIIDKHGRNINEYKRRCLKDGSWQGNTPVCQRCYCGYPGYFSHGKIKGNSYFYSDNITYECDSGFKLVGSSERHCLANGSWSGTKPSCQAEICPSLEIPKHSNMWMIIGDSYHMEFECTGGYKMNGSSLLTCLNTGEWDNKPPECNPINCTQPLEINNLVIVEHETTNNIIDYPAGHVIKYECKPGYSQRENTNVTAVCKINGSWETYGINEDVCVEIQTCPELPEIDHGSFATSSNIFNVGTQINVTCDVGYKINGSSVVLCQNDSSWSDNIGECLSIRCPNLSDIINITSAITLDDNNLTYGSVASLNCTSGLRLFVNSKPTDSVNWTCSKDGIWKGDFDFLNIDIKCVQEMKNKDFCNFPEAPLYGYFTESSEKPKTYPVGSILDVYCRQGYILNGVNKTTCLSSGLWSHSNVTECQAIECSMPPQPPHTELALLSSLQYGSLALHKCKPGFQSYGTFSVHCQANKRWSRFRGKCVRLSCGKPQLQKEAIIKGNSYLYEDHLTVSCPTGFVLEGNPVIMCLVNGTWSSLPICRS